jgi:hypothetical protein
MLGWVRLHKRRREQTMQDLMEKVEELSKRKKWLDDEISSIASAFGPDTPGYTGGCLRLEDVYCVKNSRKYGPYGPYYYLYFHRPDGMEKRYIGKRADRLKVRHEVLVRLKELEAERARILKLERKLKSILGLE